MSFSTRTDTTAICGFPVCRNNVFINVARQVLQRGARWPKRGKVTVTFGEPLRFTLEGPDEIVEKARRAVLDLGAA